MGYKDNLIKRLQVMHDNLLLEAEHARQHGGPQAMKLASRIKTIKETIVLLKNRDQGL